MSNKNIYNKLVRDLIPEIIIESGGKPKIRKLNEKHYKQELLIKLVEEASELLEDPSIEERADVAEVLHAIDEVFNFEDALIEKVRLGKRSNRGGFSDRVFLEEVIE